MMRDITNEEIMRPAYVLWAVHSNLYALSVSFRYDEAEVRTTIPALEYPRRAP